MATDNWNVGQYLKFVSERTKPCLDLASRIVVQRPRRLCDLGCGPGNSTEVLATRWPNAHITGLDTSAGMIEAASETHPSWRWVVEDIAAWADGEKAQYDIVFSNAALQWVDDHGSLFPKLLGRVAPGGALAVQMPNNADAPAQQIMRDMERGPSWAGKFPPGGVRSWNVSSPSFYYDLLVKRAASLEIWQTSYFHLMPNPEAILEWYRGTGLRPYLDALQSVQDKERFAAEYLVGLARGYPPQPNGTILLPFPRLFLIAMAK